MIVNINTSLPSHLEKIKETVLQPKLLLYVASPLIQFSPVEPNAFPETWKNGNYLVSMKSFGFLPIGNQTVGIEIIPTNNDKEFILRDNGRSNLIAKWDHWIFLKETEKGEVSYTDRVEIKAGVLTLFVWIFANGFYRWRQYRWRKLVKNRFISL